MVASPGYHGPAALHARARHADVLRLSGFDSTDDERRCTPIMVPANERRLFVLTRVELSLRERDSNTPRPRRKRSIDRTQAPPPSNRYSALRS
ncbi:unnamed protein product, partial [Brenthis ino]